ncbi:acyltransferase family protein [Pseudomonas sp. B392_1p]|uniref:acyltransferase family protein n=1 Tax=Pseudomonas sp. B392_1p TaxID=3457507 RepID=UPI003FD61D8A
MSSGVSYNPAIDGLRAIAVLSVFIFHINNQWLPGGFLGVDVFFVISGFLITSILLKDFSAGRFTYAEFYRRRVNRILPAYLCVLGCVTVAAFILMLPYDFKKFGVSALSSLFFVSNLNYALRQGDYFSNDAEQWPLLHTWSLAVEEQFYVLWPILLFVFFMYASREPNQYRKRLLIFTLVLISSSAVVATVFALDNNLAKWSYYTSFTRASELLLGGALAVFRSGRDIPGLGPGYTTPALVVLLACFLGYDKSIPFPGVSALVPCLATVILLAGRRTGGLYQVLASRPLVGIGLISYSLYLWHWPIISFTRYVFDFGSGTFVIGGWAALAIFGLSVSLAYLTYRYIETPFRTSRASFSQAGMRLFALPCAAGLFVYGAIFFSHGAPFRLDIPGVPAMQAFNSIDKRQCPDFVSLGCLGGDPHASRKYLIIGNSYAEHYFKFYDVLGKEFGIRVDLAAGGGCSPADATLKCRKIYSYVFEHIDQYDGLIFVQDWRIRQFEGKSSHAEGFDAYLQKLRALSRPLLLVGSMPRFNAQIDKVANYNRIFGTGESPVVVTIRPDYIQENSALKAFSRRVGVKFVNPYEDAASSGMVLKPMDDNGVPMYIDSNHLSVYGSERMARHLLATHPREELDKRYFP